MSLSQLATRSAFINILGSYGQQALGFLATLVLARELVPADFGTFGLSLAIYLFFARARTLGLNLIFFSVPEPDDGDVSTLLWLSAGFSLLVVVLVAAATPLLKLLYGGQLAGMVLFVSAIALFETDGLASVADTLLRRDLAYYRLATLALLATGTSLLVSLLLATNGWGVRALFAGYAVKTLVYCVGVWAFAPRFNLLAFNWERARYFLGHARNMWLGGIGSYLAFMYDDVAVGTFVGTASLGYYRKAYDLALLPLAFISGAAEVMMPTYARARDDREMLTSVATTAMDVVSKLALPAGVLLAVAAPEIIALYLGPQWLPAVPLLQALVIYAVIRPLNDMTGSLATVMGRTDVTRRYGIALSVVMLVTTTGLTLWIGAVGAALSAGLAVLVGIGVLYTGALRPFTDVRYAEVFGPPIVAVIVAAGATLLAAGQLQPGSQVVRLLLKVGVFGACYVGLLAVMQGKVLAQKARLLTNSLRQSPEPVPADNPLEEA